MDDLLKFPEGFCDIGGMTFSEIYAKKKEFVDFTLTEMKNTSGLFKMWKNYCKQKQNGPRN